MAGPSGKREGFLLQNVNVLLGGTMLAGLVLLVCLVCCCCRYTATRKPPADSPSTYWLQDIQEEEEDLSQCDEQLGVYTVEGHVRSNGASSGVWPSPPPPYSSFRNLRSMMSPGSTDSLPTYEAAMKLQALSV